MRTKSLLSLIVLIMGFYLSAFSHPIQFAKRNREKCDVLVAGGSLSGLSAALTSARAGHKTCLLEPTHWLGGQLTAQGVSAVDETWHTVAGFNLRNMAYNPKNQNKEFYSVIQKLNTGKCWVGRYCGESKKAQLLFEDLVKKERNLKVFKNTVVKFVETASTETAQSLRMTKVFAIQRFPRSVSVASIPFSQQIQDWYTLESNSNFTKVVIEFSPAQPIFPIIEASEFADVLVLSGASYNQGYEPKEEENSVNQCGQATVFPFVASFGSRTGSIPSFTPTPYKFSNRGHTFSKIWSYRRIFGSLNSNPIEKSLINWEQGNDYEHGYIFKSKDEIESEKTDWKGGLNLTTLRGAEDKAYSYFFHLKNEIRRELGKDIGMELGDLGSANGLSLFPYVRDSRRAIGVSGYKLKSSDLTSPGPVPPLAAPVVDAVAIGSYAFDLHTLQNECDMTPLDSTFVTSPRLYQIPIRALTSNEVENLVLSGKTIAQSFLASSSTRVHPIEWSIGVGSGVMASIMLKDQVPSTSLLLKQTDKIVREVNKYQPTSWQLK